MPDSMHRSCATNNAQRAAPLHSRHLVRLSVRHTGATSQRTVVPLSLFFHVLEKSELYDPGEGVSAKYHWDVKQFAITPRNAWQNLPSSLPDLAVPPPSERS